MAEGDTYNGWRNRETWLVNVWYGDYFSELHDEGEEVTADYIEQFIDDIVEEQLGGFTGFIADMIDLGCIDWHGLAAHYRD